MICIVGDRHTGKTAALINLSSETEFPIVVPNRKSADRLRYEAQKMGLIIPKPVVFNEIMRARGSRKRPIVLLDDAQGILEEVIGCRVAVSAFDSDSFDLSKMSLLTLVSEWWRSRRNRG